MRRDWLQISTNIAVLIGLMFLVYELNQNHLHNRSQLVATSFELASAVFVAQAGENPASTLSKYRSDPESLNPEERAVMEGYLSALFIQRQFVAEMIRMGTMDPSGLEGTDSIVRRYLGTCLGLEWWELRRGIYNEIAPIVDSELDKLDLDCGEQ